MCTKVNIGESLPSTYSKFHVVRKRTELSVLEADRAVPATSVPSDPGRYGFLEDTCLVGWLVGV